MGKQIRGQWWALPHPVPVPEEIEGDIKGRWGCWSWNTPYIRVNCPECGKAHQRTPHIVNDQGYMAFECQCGFDKPLHLRGFVEG